MSDNRIPPITEEWVAERRRQFTDPDGPFAKAGARGEAALRQFEIQVAEARLRGTLAAEPPVVLDPLAQARQNVLARDFPEVAPIPEFLIEHHSARLSAIGEMPVERQGRLAQETADEFYRNPTPDDGGHGGYRAEFGGKVPGGDIVDALIRDAEPAVRATATDQSDVPDFLRLLRCDAKLLRYYAIRGRHMSRRQEGLRKHGANS